MTCGANEIQKSKEKFQNRGKANTGLLKKIEVGSYEIFQTAVKNPSYTLLTYTGDKALSRVYLRL